MRAKIRQGQSVYGGKSTYATKRRSMNRESRGWSCEDDGGNNRCGGRQNMHSDGMLGRDQVVIHGDKQYPVER